MFQKVVNQVTVIGYLGNDAKSFGEDGVGTSFSLATNEISGGAGDRHEQTEWHKVVCWKGLAKACRGLTKGSCVAVLGALRYSTWIDGNEVQHRTVEIHASSVTFLDVKKSTATKGAAD